MWRDIVYSGFKTSLCLAMKNTRIFMDRQARNMGMRVKAASYVLAD